MIERKLTVSEVSINQVAVEIKVLKIGNRQVTLAVFRQLPAENIIDRNTGELKGVPWGWVNYHFDNCQQGGGHLHVVWQKGNELRRGYDDNPENLRTDEFLINDPVGRKWVQSYVQLMQLEQLFIAV